MYVWVYRKRGFPIRAFFLAGRCLKNIVSYRTLLMICRVLAPLYGVASRALDAMHVMQFRRRTNREITLDLFDAFAPRFNHVHSPSEVRKWFVDNGFRNITESGAQKHGFGMYGDRA